MKVITLKGGPNLTSVHYWRKLFFRTKWFLRLWMIPDFREGLKTSLLRLLWFYQSVVCSSNKIKVSSEKKSRRKWENNLHKSKFSSVSFEEYMFILKKENCWLDSVKSNIELFIDSRITGQDYFFHHGIKFTSM